MASFFIFISCQVFQANALERNGTDYKKLSQSSTWRSLLHLNVDTPSITDKEFLLTFNNFSPENELKATIEFLQEKQSNLCKFPARAKWLAGQGVIDKPNFNQCPALSEFLINVPVDSLHLVFSAENLSQPSSMMGHILLKTVGLNNTNELEEYGITFFTEINAINLPKTIYDTMIGGSPGFFSLSPYSEKLEQYLLREKRNVWEYKLSLSERDKELIQLHFWELKDKNIEYFFTQYNCATLTNFVLSIANPKLLSNSNFWFTPLDVIKAVHENGMVDSTNVISSPDWRIRMFSEILDEQALKQAFNRQLPNDSVADIESRLLQLELNTAVNEYEFAEKIINNNDYRDFQNKIDTQLNKLPNYNIEISNYKQPTKTPQDSKITTGFNRTGDENRAILGFIPASHEITDDNRQYFAESELKLGEFSVSYNEKDEAKIHSFNLYSMLSLTPYHTKTGGISGGFNIRYQEQLASLSETKHFTEIGGNLGLTKKFTNDVLIYALTELQLSTDFNKAHIFGAIKAGSLFYSSPFMKSIIEISHKVNSGNSSFDYSELTWHQTLFLSPSSNLKYKHSYLVAEKQNRNNYQLSFEYQF